MKPPTHYLYVFREKTGARDYRWHLRARNNKVVCDSGEGYRTAAGCVAGFRAVRRALLGDRVDFRSYNVVTEND